MTDNELSDVLRVSGEGLMAAHRIEALLDAAWSLDAAPNISTLMTLAPLD